MSNDAEQYDASGEARIEGISMPVSIDGALMKTLTPSPYLESLGVTREQRITNLLRLVRAMIKPDESPQPETARIPVPFMVLRGPLVREDFLTVTVRVKRNADGGKDAVISGMIETDE